jgi:hypothetical protein
VQLGVPLIQLAAHRPARFGWQMFSGLGHPARFSVVLEDGRVDSISVADHVRWLRPEMNLPITLPPHLCSRVEGAAAVRVEPQIGDAPDRTYECP